MNAPNSRKDTNLIIRHDSQRLQTGNPVIFFDGVCNLCNCSVHFILRHDKRKVFVFTSLQSDLGKHFISASGLSGLSPESVILYENGHIHSHSDAIIRIAEILGGLYKMVIVFRIIPKSIRDALYNFIASHRYYWFGKRESCMIPGPGLSDRFLT